MEQINKFSTKNTFQQNIEGIKNYIEKLLSFKLDKAKKNTQERVDKVLKNKESSFLNGLKNLFGKKQKSVNKNESHQEDEDEYIPQDSEFGENLGETPRFAEISPGFIGYFTSGKKSYFDRTSNLWSKKKVLEDFNFSLDTAQKSYTYAGVFPAGTISLPLPEGSIPDINSVHFTGKQTPIFQKDQNNCFYITTREKQYISFSFYTHQTLPTPHPIPQESEKIIFSSLSQETNNFLKTLQTGKTFENAQAIAQHIIKTKKYSTKVQGTLRDTSNSKNYISNLDKSPILECFSANSLFVGLCREIGIPARVCVGHMVQNLDSDGKSLLSSNNGHAWSEVWDADNNKWVRFDATPTTKEDGSERSENGDAQNQGNQNQAAESNMNQDEGQNGAGNTSPSDALDKLVQKAKDDNLTAQAQQIKDTLQKLENAKTKEQIKDILESAGLSDFAKDMVDRLGKEEILKQEQEQIKNLDDEKAIDEALSKSLLDNDFKEKLKEYARELQKKIQEQRNKVKSEMEKMGFDTEELGLYKLYKKLEKELEGEVHKQIKVLEKILPPIFHTQENKEEYFKSGSKLGGTGKMIEYHLTGDSKVFRRNREIKETNEINMFETIVIDRSGSMGDFQNASPLREAVKAAIIRAKVLEYFKVNFSIIFFDDNVEEVMSFGEKFSDKKKNNIPSRLMRAVMKSGGNCDLEAISYAFESMKKYSRQSGGKSFGNISFLGDGGINSGTESALKSLINQIRKQNFGVTAYYINGSGQNNKELQKYFGDEQSGGTVVVGNIQELTDKLIGSYNENLRKVIKKYKKN